MTVSKKQAEKDTETLRDMSEEDRDKIKKAIRTANKKWTGHREYREGTSISKRMEVRRRRRKKGGGVVKIKDGRLQDTGDKLTFKKNDVIAFGTKSPSVVSDKDLNKKSASVIKSGKMRKYVKAPGGKPKDIFGSLFPGEKVKKKNRFLGKRKGR